MTSPGLRERKKDRTRAAITRAALELFARDGFHATTINDIAEVAEVAPRTVSTYFPSKEGIVFDVYVTSIGRLAERVTRRPAGQPVHDVLREALESEGGEGDQARGVVLPPRDGEVDLARLREAAIANDPDLWALQRLYTRPLVHLITEAAAEDLGLAADSLMAQTVGETTVSVLLAANARAAREGTSAAAEFELAYEFIRAGLATIGR